MAAITNTEVFSFMGTPADVNTNQGTAITTLIAQMEKEFEATTGRKVTKQVITAKPFSDGIDCEIFGDRLYLKGAYRDMTSISALTESGSTISAVTNNNSTGYYLDVVKGIVFRMGENWSQDYLDIAITGIYGLTDAATPWATRGDVKQILIEMVAAKSGLWKNNVETDGGSIETIRTQISPSTQRKLNTYILRDV